MMNVYKEIYKTPGSFAFSSAAFIGRMPRAMTGLGIIIMLSQFRGEYALSGTVAAIFSLSGAVLAPQVSRLVDRHGQRKILPIAAIVSASFMLALLFFARQNVPAWALLACAAFAGCMPSMSAMVKARWTPLLRGRPQLKAAYALEAVLDEVSFIIGPPLAIGLSVTWFPEAGLLCAVLLQLLGVGLFVMQTRTEPQIDQRVSHYDKSPLGIAGVRTLLILLLSMGIIVGTIDVVSIAFASQHGQAASASVVLSAYALGSFIGGLLFGAIKIDIPLGRQLLYSGIATLLTTLPLFFVGNITSLAITMLLSGVFFAPTLIVAMSLVERIVPGNQLTESFAWLGSGLNVGIAMGAAVSGWLVDGLGAHSGFAVALCAGGAVLVTVLVGQRYFSNC
ncbi:MFS transporter [Advenella kashmirensis W13003]|uniref:MFS transporter n=1 Tax=Advenella kashmirensis W13003 TaxID=1424334 RepID=V8QP08_9BURK|nr:MFS transporter [Advenella kashmirensis]ETF01053.1 MFS transporter [Advenella kashmirensis W13003]